MSLEAIYHITDNVLGIKERVEKCIEDYVREFNQKLENFTIPTSPCLDELDGVEFFGDGDASSVVSDIRRKFTCLYYSFKVKTLGEACDLLDVECHSACSFMRFKPTFAAKDKFGGVCFLGCSKFNYEIPAVLPSREERMDPSLSYGKFLVDTAPLKDLTAEEFIVEVFNEYMGCAVSI